MIMKHGTSRNAIQCQISPAKELRFFSQVPCDLELDTVAYAVCRFFVKSPAMCRLCAPESYRIRLATGRKRKAQRHKCLLPAPLLELPGGWARIYYTVDAIGVTVQEVSLLKTYGREDTGDAD